MTATVDIPSRLPLGEGREPGVYDGIPLDEYHADRTALSSSGARKLLAPSCPAKFRWEQDHPPAPKDHFDIGTAFHAMVLGDGPKLARIDAGSYKTKAAQDERDAARARGAVPLLDAQYEAVETMAGAVRAHDLAGALFAPGTGRPEQSLYWLHEPTGVRRRARPDWLPNPGPGRLLVPDLKSCRSADLDAIEKDIANYGYHCQAAWYLAGVKALGLAGDEEPKFLFVFVEKEPPHLIRVVELDETALEIGRRQNAAALHIYRECMDSGVWPPYATDVEIVSLPPYIENQYAKKELS